jgi:hypothetical protein
MLPVGFEPTTPAGERPQTYELDRAAIGTVPYTGCHTNMSRNFMDAHK